MKWVTREHVKVDRVACPWLVRRFIDPEAVFEFLPKETDWSRITDGTVFDVPGCELGHHREDVSFDSILKKYGLNDPALRLLADIIRAADSKPRHPHAAGEGLRWIAHGFSALGLSDHDILDREFIVYEACMPSASRGSTQRRPPLEMSQRKHEENDDEFKIVSSPVAERDIRVESEHTRGV